MSGSGLQPDVISYGAIISACENGKQENASAVLTKMRLSGLQPKVIIRALTSSCEMCNQTEKALECFAKLSRSLSGRRLLRTLISLVPAQSATNQRWLGSLRRSPAALSSVLARRKSRKTGIGSFAVIKQRGLQPNGIALNWRCKPASASSLVVLWRTRLVLSSHPSRPHLSHSDAVGTRANYSPGQTCGLGWRVWYW
jgi:hypothetical protein